MRTAQEIFDHHLEVFGAGNLEAILTDYDKNSVMIYGNQSWHGLEGAREFFKMWLDNLIPLGSEFELMTQLSFEHTLYITWRAESEKYKFDFGTNTFIFENDKVRWQTVGAHVTKK